MKAAAGGELKVSWSATLVPRPRFGIARPARFLCGGEEEQGSSDGSKIIVTPPQPRKYASMNGGRRQDQTARRFKAARCMLDMPRPGGTDRSKAPLQIGPREIGILRLGGETEARRLDGCRGRVFCPPAPRSLIRLIALLPSLPLSHMLLGRNGIRSYSRDVGRLDAPLPS